MPSPYLMDPRGLVVTKKVYFSLLTHTNQLLLVTLCHTPAGIGKSEVGRDVPTPNSYVDSWMRWLCLYYESRSIPKELPRFWVELDFVIYIKDFDTEDIQDLPIYNFKVPSKDDTFLVHEIFQLVWSLVFWWRWLINIKFLPSR